MRETSSEMDQFRTRSDDPFVSTGLCLTIVEHAWIIVDYAWIIVDYAWILVNIDCLPKTDVFPRVFPLLIYALPDPA